MGQEGADVAATGCSRWVQMLVPTVDTVRFSFLLEACLDVQRSVLFTGVTGVGKSVISSAALEALSVPSTAPTTHSPSTTRVAGRLITYPVGFSAQTSSIDTQLLIEDKLEKKRKTRWDVLLAGYLARTLLFLKNFQYHACHLIQLAHFTSTQ
jgi:hypothetical protein